MEKWKKNKRIHEVGFLEHFNTLMPGGNKKVTHT